MKLKGEETKVVSIALTPHEEEIPEEESAAEGDTVSATVSPADAAAAETSAPDTAPADTPSPDTEE